jgi:alkylation response protein AidB-like acyl-CoA dehydrogenase
MDQAAALRDLGEEVAGELVGRCTWGLGHLILTCHKLKLSRAQNVMFELANRITEVEHAAAFCRRAAEARDPAIQAACRLFAAETAAHLATSALRILASSDVDDSAVEAMRSAINTDELLSTRHGTQADMDAVLAWLLED